ncbi:uncharacterized protein [Gossypium hirsutum]|uniref:Retrotransposon gag domain-containing protein n=1 Tax=Gossypium hirsutum TaxID=3635 RepID=A0A1U8IST1_GOSHI|nr:uncharacterized protein LOC107899937 [Gossypium hirsutum]
MQDQLQLQVQERFDKMQRDMSEKIQESQNNMMTKLTQLLTGGGDKGKGPMVDIEEGNEDESLYSPSFTPPHVRTQAKYSHKSTVTIRPQQVQAVAKKERINEELPKQLEERCKWLEGKFNAMEVTKSYRGIDAKELSLVLDLVLPHKFKMPEFEKYNGTSCPKAHITMFCRRMAGYVNNDQLLIHYFQDSLTGAASKWYNQLSRSVIGSWRDLAQVFIKQYNNVTDMVPDRITLQNMEKKPNESFRQYAQMWREVAVQVQPLLLERETTILFINTLKAPFITHMLGSVTKSFSDIVMNGEMIENAIRNGKIDVEESNKRSASRRRENEPRKVAANQQGSSRQEVGTRQNTERPQFTPIPVSYMELYQSLFDAHVVSPFHVKPLQPPYPE